MTDTFGIPAILKLPHSLSHEQLARNINMLKAAGRLGKVPMHLCSAIAQLPILSTCYRDENFSYYSVDAWYNLACQLPFAKNEFAVASKRAFYNHIATLKKSGILKEDCSPNENASEAISLSTHTAPTQWLRISPPNIEFLTAKEPTKSKQLRSQEKHPSCMLIDDHSLSHGGSLHITARLLNHVVNISSKPCFENIEGEVTIKDAKTQQEGTVFLRTSSPRHLPVMDASHVVLVNVIYKLIIYRMASMFSENSLASSYQNIFGFSKAMLAKYLGKTDGGETRKYFDSVMEIITSTRFDIHDKGGASWFFKKLGLTDPDGQPFSKASIQLLLAAGELNYDNGAYDQHSPTHIYVRMAPHLDDSIRSALVAHESQTQRLESHDFHSLLQYPRQRSLFSQNSGILQLLTDYFAYRLVSPGAFYGSDLSSLLNKINYSIKNGQSMAGVICETLKTLMHSNTILATDNVEFNSRNQIRLKSLYSIINDRYLVRVCATSCHTQLSKIRYEFVVMHLNREQLTIVKQRQQFLLDYLRTTNTRVNDLKKTASITQQDPKDTFSIMRDADEWLLPYLKSSFFLTKRKAG